MLFLGLCAVLLHPSSCGSVKDVFGLEKVLQMLVAEDGVDSCVDEDLKISVSLDQVLVIVDRIVMVVSAVVVIEDWDVVDEDSRTLGPFIFPFISSLLQS